MTNKMKNVPELRFPEFIEEWEEKRLPVRLEKRFSTAPLK